MAKETIERKGGLSSFGAIMWEYISFEENEFLFNEIFLQRSYFKNGIALSPLSSSSCSSSSPSSPQSSPASLSITILDIGANIGLFSLFCVEEIEKMKQESELNEMTTIIYAVEPVAPIFDVLRRNLQFNKSQNVETHLLQIGVGGRRDFDDNKKEEEEIFHYFSETPGESTRNRKERDEQRKKLFAAAAASSIDEIYEQQQLRKQRKIDKEEGNEDDDEKEEEEVEEENIFKVKMKSISNLIKDYDLKNITILKIDVEGDELNVLEGIESQHWLLIQQIVVEVCNINNRLESIVDLLKSRDQGNFDNVTIEQEETVINEETGYISFIPNDLQLYKVYATRLGKREEGKL